MRKMRVSSLAVTIALACCGGERASAQHGSEDAAVRVQQLVQKFFAAEQAFDAKTLETLISKDYFEVSPAGELDEHERFLGFYAADKRVEYPPSKISDEHMEFADDRRTAVYCVTTTFAMKNADGSARDMAIRGTFVAQMVGVVKGEQTWKLLSAAYTTIRPKPKS